MTKAERKVAIDFTAETGWLTYYCESCCLWVITCPDCGCGSCNSGNPCCTRYKTAIAIAEEKLEARLREVRNERSSN
jgi:hypothetical protein